MGGCVIINKPLQIGSSPTVLIVCFRFIGDVLVTSPLVASIKQALPAAEIDYLVFEGTEGVLSHNHLIRDVITVPRKVSNAGVLLSMFRKYDLAIAAYPSDRTLLAAALAGKRSIGLIYGGRDVWWKNAILSAWRFCDDQRHVVANILALLEPLGIPPVSHVAMGCDEDDRVFASTSRPAGEYIVLHPYSRSACKQWPAEKWGKLAELIHDKTRYRVLFTTTPEPSDGAYLRNILDVSPNNALTFEKSCTLSQLAAVVKDCSAFVGIDTVVTHMAAALSVPTFAIFGPSLTRYWGPWPNGSRNVSPYIANKGVQRIENVTVVQKDWPCVPCNQESCIISTREKMECLEELTADEVFYELQMVLCA